MIAVLVGVWLSAALFSAYVAAEKNRNPWLWLILGVPFGIVALIAIAGVPAWSEEEWQAQRERVQEKRAANPQPWNPLAGPPPISKTP